MIDNYLKAEKLRLRYLSIWNEISRRRHKRVNMPLSPINLIFTYAICYGEIKLGKTFLSLVARGLEIIL